MPDLLPILRLVAAVPLVADLLIAGDAMAMAGMSAMASAIIRPLTAGGRV